MNDLFVERITQTRAEKRKKVSGIMVETRSQKSSERQKAMLEVEVHSDLPWMRTRKHMDRKAKKQNIGECIYSGRTRPRFCQFHRDPGPRRDVGTVRYLYRKCCDYKITHRQHHDSWRDGKTGNVLTVFRKSEEHFMKLLSIYCGNGYRRRGRNPGRRRGR